MYKMYNLDMKTISATNARKHIANIINTVRESGDVFAIGRHQKPEVLVIKFPSEYNATLNDITNSNAYSESFAFLKDEPDLYTTDDLKTVYV